jgi:hypothetical protein
MQECRRGAGVELIVKKTVFRFVIAEIYYIVFPTKDHIPIFLLKSFSGKPKLSFSITILHIFS